jgi:hypothetical protein
MLALYTVERLIGTIDAERLVQAIVCYAVIGAVLQAVSLGKSWGRFAYVALLFVSYGLPLLVPAEEVTRFDIALLILLLPVQVWGAYELFNEDSSAWFERREGTRTGA